MKKANRLWTWSLFAMLAASVARPASAQDLGLPSTTQKLNSRTVIIKDGWSCDFALKRPGQAIASLQIYSATNWEDSTVPGLVLGVAVDGKLRSHVVTFRGGEFHHYEVHLGFIDAGEHTLELLRADSSALERQRDLKLVNLRLEIYHADHPQYPILAHAPLLFGRRDGRASDIPLLLAYQTKEDPSRGLQEITYTVIYSNEDGGTPALGLLHRWGRYTDIEWTYRVELEPNGERRRAFYQGREHKTVEFRGGLENNQPALQVATQNNMLSDTLASRLRFALAPRRELPVGEARERLMLAEPWIWQVSAAEARREQRLATFAQHDPPINDLQRYLFVEFTAQPRRGGASDTCGGFFLAKYRGQAGEYASHVWSPRLVITSTSPYARQTAIPLPAGAVADDLMWLDFVADPHHGSIVLTGVNQLFALDAQNLPRFWPPSWNGRVELRPGERVRFHIEGFQMKRSRFWALHEGDWSYKPDPWRQGGPDRWGEGKIHEQLWPKLRNGDAWTEQSFEGVTWYRQLFALDRSWRGEKMWLTLGKIAGNYQMWLNNKPLALSDTSGVVVAQNQQALDISSLIRFDRENSLVVRVEGGGLHPGILRGPLGIGNTPNAALEIDSRDMIDPAIDQHEPFEYLQQPWAMIGSRANGVATQITPEGFLFTGAAEIMFYGGADVQPLSSRTKTLHKDYLPILNYKAQHGSIQYNFETFVAAEQSASSTPMNYVQVEITNLGNTPQPAVFGLGVRFRGEARRFPSRVGFHNNWQYRVAGRQLLRGDEIICLLPDMPANRIELPQRSQRQAHEPAGIIIYNFNLASGATQHLTFALPETPLPTNSVITASSINGEAANSRKQTEQVWESFLTDGAQFSFPESKITQALQAHLIYNAILFGGTQPLPRQHAGLAAEAARAFDVMGYHNLAERILRQLLPHAQEATLARVHESQDAGASWEMHGQICWAVRQHLELTRNVALGRDFLPVLKAVATEIEKLSQPPEMSNVHIEALAILQHAAEIAQMLGAQPEFEQYSRKLAALQENLKTQQNAAAPTPNDRLAPGETGPISLLATSFMPQPLTQLDRLAAVLRDWHGRGEEGLFTSVQNGGLDPNATFALAYAALLRNDAKTVVQNLYALLLHTSASHHIIGERVTPWGDRQEHGAVTPFNPFGARLITLLRDMLIREDGRDLHLFSAVSPAWLKPGDEIALSNADTKFGRLSFKATVHSDRLVIEINQHWHNVPRFLSFHVPAYVQVQSVLSDRQEIAAQGDVIQLSPHASRVEIIWKNEAERQRLNLNSTITDFKNEYQGRYHLWRAQITQ